MQAITTLTDQCDRCRAIVRAWTPAWLQAIVVFLTLTFLMGAFVHRSFQGHWWGPFLPGAQFGVPEKIDRQFHIVPTTHTGWDGQFYYYQANDLLATRDTPQHLDNPPYRYQRIGAPLLARLASWIFFQRYVSGFAYHVTQIAVVALGYGFLVSWLRQCRHSSLWALAWLVSDGVINALAFGMPDPVGDGLFAIFAVGLMRNQMRVYLPAAFFLPLVREAYAVICGLVFLATAFGWVGWGAQEGPTPAGRLLGNRLPTFLQGRFAGSWRDLLWTAVPCLAVVAWQLYVTRRFGISPSKAGSGVMLDYPLFGWWKGVEMVIARNRPFEVFLHYFALTLIFVTLATLWEQRRNHVLALFCIPYILLLCCMSWVAWEDYSGYMKAAGTVIVMLLLFLPQQPELLRTACLLFLIGEGLVMGYERKIHLQFIPYVEPAVAAAPSGEPLATMTGRLSDFNAKIEVLNEEEIFKNRHSDYNGLWKRFHRRLGPMLNVRVTNTSQAPWESLPEVGMNAVNLSYQWREADTGKLVLEPMRRPIGRPMPPGESREFTFPLAYPGPGKYDLHISMIQEGHLWFYDLVPQYKLRVDIER